MGTKNLKGTVSSDNIMKTLAIVYAVYLFAFCSETTGLTLLSPHHVDKDFLIVNYLSLGIFIPAAIFLSEFYPSHKRERPLIILLLFALMIFGYYSYNIISKGDLTSILSYQPLIGLFLGLVLTLGITFRKRK